MAKVVIGAKEYEVDDTVATYLTTLKTSVTDSATKLKTIKEDTIKEVKRESELKLMKDSAIKAGIKVSDDVTYDELKGMNEALKLIKDSKTTADYRKIDGMDDIDFDNIIVEI